MTRLRSNEAAIATDLAHLLLTAFVVWGRFGHEPLLQLTHQGDNR